MAQARGAVSTEPVKVDVRSVEKELANLWRKVAEGGLPGISGPVSRTIISNLLVYASSDEEAEEAAAVITELAADHPSRAVITDNQPGEPGHELEADVSMFCSITERGRKLCGEQVRLHAHGAVATALGTIMPVLIPDLPIFFWTPGDLESPEEVISSFIHLSDHWIIDSRRFSSWSDRFRLVITLGVRHESEIMLHDLAWTSLTHWREAVAQHFDPVPAREYLRGVRHVEIEFGATRSGVPPIEPVLLIGWLMAQLEWENPRVRRSDDGTWLMRASAQDGSIEINLKPSSNRLQPITGVSIESVVDGRKGIFESSLTEAGDEMILQASAPDVPNVRRSMRIDLTGACNQLCQILEAPGNDRLYEKAIPMIEGLVLEIEGQV